MLSAMFPNLYPADGISPVGLEFSDVVVMKSHICPDTCVIVKARKPVEWLLDHCAMMQLPPSWVDAVDMRRNTDGSLSVMTR